MTPDGTLETIRNLVCDLLEEPGLRVESATKPSELRGWSSLLQVTLAVALQNTFQIRFTLHELDDLGTLQELASLIEQKLHRTRQGRP